MAKEIVTEFLDEATVEITYYNYNASDSLEDCTSTTITIIDPSGTTKVDASGMSHDGTGTYSYQYHKGTSSDPMDVGEWRIRINAIDGSGATAVISSFASSFTVI